MLLSISALMIVLYTIYYGTKVYPNKQSLRPMTGKSISMALGMVSSLAIGLFIAIPLQGQLAVATVLAITVSTLVACFIGKPFGLLAVIEALAATLMGSMMGAMLGEMLPTNNVKLMIISMDAIYLFSISSVMMLINKEIAKNDFQTPGTRQSFSFLLTLAIPFLLIGMATLLDTNHMNDKKSIGEHNHHHMMKE